MQKKSYSNQPYLKILSVKPKQYRPVHAYAPNITRFTRLLPACSEVSSWNVMIQYLTDYVTNRAWFLQICFLV